MEASEHRAGFSRSHAAGSVSAFRQQLADHMLRLASEGNREPFAMPVVLVLVVDEKNGGDSTAGEIVRRFHLLDRESRGVLDFYFLGWRMSSDGSPEFDLGVFEAYRETLRRVGVRSFGGNADIVVVDAWLRDGRVSLDFAHAIHLDLSLAATENTIDTVGAFLGALILAAEDIDSLPDGSAVVKISDRLGLVTARSSLVNFFLDKWASFIGGKKLAALATRNVGPSVDLAHL